MADGDGAEKNTALILMGIKHCGKSTQGRLLSRHFACPLFDTDDVIQEMTGKSPREIYREQGEGGFFAAEKAACEHLAQKLSARAHAAKPFAAVIATGGGICKNDAALASLRAQGTFVFLRAEESLAADRIVREVSVAPDGSLKNMPAYIAQEHPRTLDEVRASFHRFYEDRTKKYHAICDVQVEMTPAPPDENMQAILRALGQIK